MTVDFTILYMIDGAGVTFCEVSLFATSIAFFCQQQDRLIFFIS